MNTGAEAVETALKAARRWAYDVKALNQIKLKLSHLMVISMVVLWRQYLYHQKLSTNVVMVRY